METLIEILKRANKSLEDGWLYLPENQKWDATTTGMIIDDDELSDSEVDENDEPIIAKEKGLVSTLDSGTIESIVASANSLESEITGELLLESFLYYCDYDAFLPCSGFKPLPHEEHEKKLDRDFYDLLGDELEEVRCKNEVCQRGAIKGSAFCKVHHFEMIQKKSCPFTD
ncbi:MAG: hypothetical protein JKX76_14895 [Colwellia sp.]|nr:hypothetical protein [Colwellia sp.]